jgi:hypothetical protein
MQELSKQALLLVYKASDSHLCWLVTAADIVVIQSDDHNERKVEADNTGVGYIVLS